MHLAFCKYVSGKITELVIWKARITLSKGILIIVIVKSTVRVAETSSHFYPSACFPR